MIVFFFTAALMIVNYNNANVNGVLFRIKYKNGHLTYFQSKLAP